MQCRVKDAFMQSMKVSVVIPKRNWLRCLRLSSGRQIQWELRFLCRIIENALAKYNQSNPIRVYGDNTITSKDKVVIRRMAAYIGVSYTALVIRLRDMGLFEYHNILEYISNELNLGGVSQ